MSQLRKLRRHVRPLVAVDLETVPLEKRLRAGAFAAEGGLSAETIAQQLGLHPAQAQILVETWGSRGTIFDEVDRYRSTPEAARERLLAWSKRTERELPPHVVMVPERVTP